MEKDFHDIDRIFKAAIDNGYREQPSPAVWDMIDHELESKKFAQISRKYNNLKRLTAALVLLLVCLGAYELYNVFGSRHVISKQTETLAQQPSIEQPETNVTEDPTSITAENMNDRTINKKQPAFITTKDIIINGQQVFRSNENGIHTRQQGNTTVIETGNDKLITGTLSNTMANNSEDEKTGNEKKTANPFVLYPAQIFNPLKIEGAVSSPLRQTSTSTLTNNIRIKKPKPYFSLTAVYGAEDASYRIQNEKMIRRWIGTTGPGSPGGQVRFEEKEEIKNTPQKVRAFSSGLLLDYQLHKRWSIQSGVLLSQITNTTPYTRKIYAVGTMSSNVNFRFNGACGYAIVDPKTDIVTTAAPAVGDSLFAEETKSTMQYLSVPLAVKYTVNAGKFKFFASAGVAANILLEGKLESSINDGISKKGDINTELYGLRPVYYSGLLGVGAEYVFSKRISLNVSPNTRLALNSLNKDGIVTSYVSTFGVQTGLRVRL